MHCKLCNYPLWNLTSRHCPECGQGFELADYTFAPGSVVFACPLCAHEHRGTSPSGHMEIARFECNGCHQLIAAADMAVCPVAPPTDRTDGGEPGAGAAWGAGLGGTRAAGPVIEMNPWLGDAPLLQRWARTALYSITAPIRLISATPTLASPLPALRYAAMSLVAFWLVMIVVTMLYTVGFTSVFVPGGGPPPMGFDADMLGFVAVMYSVYLVLTLAVCLLWSLVTHKLLAMSGPVSGPYRTTIQCFGYAAAGFGISMLACLYYAGFLLWGVIAAVMIWRVHRTTPLRAAVCVGASLLIVGVIGVIVITVLGRAMIVPFLLRGL